MNWQTYWQYLRNQKNPKPSELKLGVYLRGAQDFEFFVRYFFKEYCPFSFSEMHQDFFMDEADLTKRGRRDVIAAPRGHAKTTFKVLFKVVHAVVYQYEPFIVVIGRTREDAAQKIIDVAEELKSNQKLISMFGSLLSNKKHISVSKGVTTKNGITMMAKSRGQSLRGLKKAQNRPSLIICDDIESLEETMSQEQRLKTMAWFTKDILPMGQIDGSSNITVIGTCLHPDSLIENLLANPGWHARRYQAVKEFPSREDLWQKYKQIYTDLANPERMEEARKFYGENKIDMDKGVELLWGEAETFERLTQMRINEGEAAFLSEKQNVPWDPSRTIFDMDNARRFKLVYSNGQWIGLQWLDGSEKIVHRDSLVKVVAFHDPVMGKTLEGDYAAVVVVALDADEYLYCLDTWLGKENPSTQVQQAFRLHEKWKLDYLYLEENNFQGLIKNIYRDSNLNTNSHSLTVKGVVNTVNKELRISSLEPFMSNEYLLFNENLDPKFVTQMKLYPTTYDDGPDALQGAVAQLKRSNLTELYKVLGEH